MPGRSKDELTERGWAELETLLAKGGERSFPTEYERLRERLTGFFRWKGLPHPEDCVDTTFDRVARTLAEGKAVRAEDPASYVLGVARLVYLETTRSEIRLRQSARELAEAPAGDAEHERMLRALDACLEQVSDDDQDLLTRYHRGSGGSRIQERRNLAEELGVTLNTLRIRMHRVRQGLEDCVRRRTS